MCKGCSISARAWMVPALLLTELGRGQPSHMYAFDFSGSDDFCKFRVCESCPTLAHESFLTSINIYKNRVASLVERTKKVVLQNPWYSFVSYISFVILRNGWV